MASKNTGWQQGEAVSGCSGQAGGSATSAMSAPGSACMAGGAQRCCGVSATGLGSYFVGGTSPGPQGRGKEVEVVRG